MYLLVHVGFISHASLNGTLVADSDTFRHDDGKASSRLKEDEKKKRLRRKKKTRRKENSSGVEKKDAKRGNRTAKLFERIMQGAPYRTSMTIVGRLDC
jgi:hypothetical protein